MRRRASLGCVVAGAAGLLCEGAWPVEGEIARYLQAGWRIDDRHERQEIRSGIAPYQGLERRVQIVEYVLSKGADTKRCRMEYDSQRDRIVEECA